MRNSCVRWWRLLGDVRACEVPMHRLLFFVLSIFAALIFCDNTRRCCISSSLWIPLLFPIFLSAPLCYFQMGFKILMGRFWVIHILMFKMRDVDCTQL